MSAFAIEMAPAQSAPHTLRVCEIISALSYALDLTEGRPMGHSVRTCLIGMRIGKAIGLDTETLRNLYYALLMKDAGCSSNASRLWHIIGDDEIKAKRDVKTTDWTRVGWESLQYAWAHVRTGRPFFERLAGLLTVAANNRMQSRDLVRIRCERGASIARRIGLSEQTALAIHSLDEHWDGGGYPDGLRQCEIPEISRILNLAQTLDVFYTEHGAGTAIETVRQRSGRWFDPGMVLAAASLSNRGELWADLDTGRASECVHALEPAGHEMVVTDQVLDDVCNAFADVIDAKSPFTYNHSTGVAAAASTIAKTLDLPAEQRVIIQRAALLHDIGKLSVPNSILEKAGKPTEDEWQTIRRHPFYTLEILKRIPGFRDLSEIACNHHERLDGKGYFRNLAAPELTLPSRILAVADVYDALAAERPYREALPPATVSQIMRKDAPVSLDGLCLEALLYSVN